MSEKKLPFAAVNRAALASLPNVLDWCNVKHKTSGHEIQMINPLRVDKGFGSFSINQNSGAWCDFAGDAKGADAVSLVAYLRGLTQGEACKQLAGYFGIAGHDSYTVPDDAPARAEQAKETIVLPVPFDFVAKMPRKMHRDSGDIVQLWRYNDEDGNPLCFIARIEPGANGRNKDFYPLTVWRDSETGVMKWRWRGIPAPRPLYGLDRLAQRKDAPVMICEGEKATDAAGLLFPDYVATCWLNGAESVTKADFGPLKGRDCVIWPDNDDAGVEATKALVSALGVAGAASIRVIDTVATFGTKQAILTGGKPAFDEGGAWGKGDDAADALARGWSAGDIESLRANGRLITVEAAPECASNAAQITIEADNAPAATPSPIKPKKPAKAPKNTGNGHGSPFRLSERGLFFQSEDMDAPAWICAKIEIIAKTRDKFAENWGVLVKFSDSDSNEKVWNIPALMLATSEGADVIKGLASKGLAIGSGHKARQRLIDFLGRYDGNERATIVSNIGWHDGTFLFPDCQIGDYKEHLIFNASDRQREAMRTAGALSEWQANVARYCVGNSRLTFAACTAFASPLLDIIGAESGGFHLWGYSSEGKTTILQLTASICGAPSYMKTWRATDNAIEAIAASYSGCLLPLDEIHMCDPRIVGETVYMLGNGCGKDRALDRGGLRGSLAEWRLMFLSSGEKTLSAHMQEARKEVKSGMDIRLLAIKSNASAGMGVFENLHGHASSNAFSNAIKAACAMYYGTAIRAFIERLVFERTNGAIAEYILTGIRRFCETVVPNGAHGQVFRAANRFALVAMAGELATKWGVTQWPEGMAWDAAIVCFTSWLGERGTTGNKDDADILAKIRLFFEQHGDSRFTRLSDEAVLDDHSENPYRSHTNHDDHAPRTIQRCGYRGKDKVSGLINFYVYPETFRKEICAGIDVKRACELLASIGALESNNHNMLQVRCTPEAKQSKSKRTNVYCVNSNIFTYDAQS